MIHRIKTGTNFGKAYAYIRPAISHCPYGTVFGDHVPSGSPFYAVNKDVPVVDNVAGKPIACAGLLNLMLRAVGKRVPFTVDQSHLWDGGTPAYWHYYSGEYSLAFDLNRVKRIAEETGSGVLIMRQFRSANHDQGHVAICLPDGKVLQSIHGPAGDHSGLNAGWSIEKSHDGGYYERYVTPENWIDYSGDNF